MKSQSETVINEAKDDNSCASIIKVKPLLIPKSKIKFSLKKHKCKS
jgi:hypothetical protein